MSFDGIVVRAVTKELQDTLTGGRIAKIYQPSEWELVFHIRAKGDNHRLQLSAHPAYPRLHLTEKTADNPLSPPMFCMLVRKHLEGSVIQSLSQVALERIVHLDVKTRNELGDEVVRRLVVEIMGRHSNLILLDPASGKILDGIRRVGVGVSRHRQVIPGAVYQPPPEQDKRNPLDTDRESFLRSIQWNEGRLDKQLVRHYFGLGPQIAREIVHRGGIGDREQLWEAFSQVMTAIREHRYEPTLVHGKKPAFAALPLTHLAGERESFDSISRCLETFFHGKAERDRVRQQNHDLIRRLKNTVDKNENKLKKLEKEYLSTERADDYRTQGELVTAHMHQIRRGDTKLKAINYYDPDAPEVTIDLEPRLNPSENAQRYFKLYNKAKSARKWIREQQEKARQESAYLESVLVQLENASSAEVEEIKEELVEQGFLKAAPARKKKKNPSRPKPASYRSSEGIPILVGRNNKQNDALTHRMATPTDTWLHTKEIPGSHVVIRARHFGEETLKEAALLAAYHSKARESSQVPVDYTLIKHVKKPSGSPPGFVIYEEQKTLFVTPEEQAIRKLEVED
ncbi:Rqc2 family fibronectin-binding protein [Desmospora profundinema]|uniref:Rqc2 homolog RqcH n=1 Tax=Desmospora profundinema TaxID=1571184 RepID=A0ABU1IQV4_9BACL|nr:NFACT RNA binding domain-containing protein [Desmospora profundinema]MDR6227164.1 putative ribosome quality control (RQC) complex YloA/Tae2 family protein [Desmospora profundinema]